MHGDFFLYTLDFKLSGGVFFFYFRSTCLQDNRKLIVRNNDSDGAYSFSFNWTNIGKIFW